MELAQITQQAQDGTRRLIEQIGAAHGVELDVSGRSLGWLDDHIEAQRETWQRELLPEKLELLKNMLGCYLGECLVTLGGRWVWMADQPAVELETKPDDDGSVEAVFAYPFTRLEKHIDLGSEHSIFRFFVQLATMTGRMTPIERVPRWLPVTDDSIERILGRAAGLRNGTVRLDDDEDKWHIVIDDPDDSEGRLTFALVFTLEDYRVTKVVSDARLDVYSKAQAVDHAAMIRTVADALRREGVGFGEFGDVVGFAGEQFETAEVDDSACTIDPNGDVPITLREAHVAGEPWIWFGAYFGELGDLDADWLLARSGDSVHLDVEAVEDSIFLSTAFPIRCLTGARVLELIADLVDWHAELSEDEDEDEGDGDDA